MWFVDSIVVVVKTFKYQHHRSYIVVQEELVRVVSKEEGDPTFVKKVICTRSEELWHCTIISESNPNHYDVSNWIFSTKKIQSEEDHVVAEFERGNCHFGDDEEEDFPIMFCHEGLDKEKEYGV